MGRYFGEMRGWVVERVGGGGEGGGRRGNRVGRNEISVCWDREQGAKGEGPGEAMREMLK